jgi:ribosome-binding factor A
MAFKRAERVAGLLKEEISKIIQFELKDPRLGFVTVTAVRLTDDLRDARVFCGILGEAAARKETLEVLARAAPFIRREVGTRCRLRYAPTLTFHLDETAEKAARIDQLLRESTLPGARAAGDAGGGPGRAGEASQGGGEAEDEE